MAAHRRSPEAVTNAFVEELRRGLPKGIKFTAHHLSTPPTITEPLCYPPAYPAAQTNNSDSQSDTRARKPLKTYCEKHFLTVSIDAPESKDQVLALALEIYIYTTAHLSIIFVSKADSTGYLELLKLPKGTPSPIREVTTTFISYLVANRRRRGIQFVVNLFARSQSQYLFPGSVKNSGKHILDDRGLVKWWCRVLNPLLQDGGADKKKWDKIHGYLIIPGLDDYETRAFLPRTAAASKQWTLGHPLERISPYISDPVTYGSNIPARCIIPTYPDDPKARFVQELEESTSEKAKLVGGWKSPRTLDQFWEMMSFRQECSSGRLTGFIWLVFDPPTSTQRSTAASGTERSEAAFIQSPNASFSAPPATPRTTRPLTPESSQGRLESTVTPSSAPITPIKPRAKKLKKKALKGRIIPRQPKVKTQQRARFPKESETAYYYWPEEGRGQVVLDESGYTRAVELLLHLEFGTLEQAITSSTRWTKEVNFGKSWSLEIIGQCEPPIRPTVSSTGKAVNDLSSMIKKKRPAPDAIPDRPEVPTAEGAAVNTLGGSLIRKKAKTTTDTLAPPPISEAPKINTLGTGLVRKKPKAA
ncbi:putative Histone acetylation protein-domain-containing protein [Seiridium cardinale]|uniref:histone acetyltransferase n=1 Tax=Seiridium cardinale TaxID=138064 RepID=A0ABR2Y3D6_9PEZI